MRRIALVTALTLGFVAFGGAIASAHVTVDAPGATKGGGDQIITFRVPTESDSASTTQLKLQLPTDTPLASVDVLALPGWTFAKSSVKLATPIHTDDGDITDAVSEIDWKADNNAAAITPGEFGEFTIIAGQLPDADSLTFKALQTYSDGTVVSWTDVEAPGSTADLDHPAPVLELAAAAASGPGGDSSNTAPIILSIVALVIAVAAAGYTFVTRAKRQNVTP
jgi:uncharacterized protein YcnI